MLRDLQGSASMVQVAQPSGAYNMQMGQQMQDRSTHLAVKDMPIAMTWTNLVRWSKTIEELNCEVLGGFFGQHFTLRRRVITISSTKPHVGV